MSELLKVFDSYNDIEHKAFFTYTYNTLPSELRFETEMDERKKNMDDVLRLIECEKNNFDLVFKNWSTEAKKNASPEKNFPNQLLYKNREKKCLLWVSLANHSMVVNFLYDCNDSDLESWIATTTSALQNNFCEEEAPVFKVLAKQSYGFDTEDVRTERTVVDVKRNYNDDFEPVHNCITNALVEKGSGLILLHGTPGTGKTTYIKSLITKHDEIDFIFVQNEFVHNLLDPDFVSFMLQQKNSVLIIEDAEKVIASRSQEKEASVVSTILQLTDGLFSDYLNIKIICTFNSNLSKIDPALLRKGRMIAMYQFKPLHAAKTNRLLTSLGKGTANSEMTLADIFNSEQDDFENISKGRIGFQH